MKETHFYFVVYGVLQWNIVIVDDDDNIGINLIIILKAYQLTL